MKVLSLDILTKNDCFAYSQLAEIAADSGGQIQYVQEQGTGVDYAQSAWEQLEQLLDDADSMILSYSDVLRVPAFLKKIHQKIKDGARLLIILKEDIIDSQNAFLARYDLTFTKYRIRSIDSPTIKFTRSAESFRDFRLFSGVDKVVAQQPNAIWYSENSLPILVGADEGIVLDGNQDLPSDWNTRELASIAGWHSENGGGVLAVAGNYLSDPNVGATGVKWPGIEANRQFAKNIIQYLVEGTPADSPYGIVSQIETTLGDFVLKSLRNDASDWWTSRVPEQIRQKCEQRLTSEAKGYLPFAYLDLIDLKVLIEKNWTLFEPILISVGIDESKNKAMSWVNRVNDLRKYVAHALKQHISNFQFSVEDISFLKECLHISRNLTDSLGHK